MSKITLAVTGASGITIAFRVIQYILNNTSNTLHLIFTKDALITIKYELDVILSTNSNVTKDILIKHLNIINKDNLIIYTEYEWSAPVASGTNHDDAMIICPCSMNTLGKIANGISNNLLTRAAEVIIKENRKLIIAPRETPLTTVHLNNMLTLSKMGVTILPLMPAFYHKPTTIDDLINFIVSRILNQINIQNNLVKPWGETNG